MSRYAEALAFAARAHDGQVRKGTAIPYITHPVGVSALVARFGGDEGQMIGGLLHDVLEDCPRISADQLEVRFGARVLAIVRACTDSLPDAEGRKPAWRARKEAYIAHVAETPADALLVVACDKLFNAGAIVDDLEAGLDVFARFTGGRDGTLWYYASLAAALGRRLGSTPLIHALDDRVERMFTLAGETRVAA